MLVPQNDAHYLCAFCSMLVLTFVAIIVVCVSIYADDTSRDITILAILIVSGIFPALAFIICYGLSHIFASLSIMN